MKRVLRYEGTAYHKSTRSSSTSIHCFNEEHLKLCELEYDFNSDGVSLLVAEKICEVLNKKMSHSKDIRYSFRVPIKEYL
jgi:hypothetical protein